jgi:hypothetical protein
MQQQYGLFSLVISKDGKTYILGSVDQKDFWLSCDGEGLAIPANDLFDLLDKYFNENF